MLFTKNSAVAQDPLGNIKMIADREEDLFYLRDESHKAFIAGTDKNSKTEIWDIGLAYVNHRDLASMAKNKTAIGINIKHNSNVNPWKTCLKGKLIRFPFHSRDHRASGILDIVHSDVCGLMRTNSLSGARYFVTDRRSQQVV